MRKERHKGEVGRRLQPAMIKQKKTKSVASAINGGDFETREHILKDKYTQQRELVSTWKDNLSLEAASMHKINTDRKLSEKVQKETEFNENKVSNLEFGQRSPTRSVSLFHLFLI